VQVIQVIVELRRQLLARDGADIRHDEAALQEAGDHRAVVSAE